MNVNRIPGLVICHCVFWMARQKSVGHFIRHASQKLFCGEMAMAKPRVNGVLPHGRGCNSTEFPVMGQFEIMILRGSLETSAEIHSEFPSVSLRAAIQFGRKAL